MKVYTIPLLLLGFAGVAAAAPAKEPLLGIAPLQISPELREHFGAPQDRGVLVDRVQPDSPAARAGIAVGDVVTAVAGSEASSVRDIQGALAEHKVGDTLDVTVVRDHKRLQLRATLDDKFTHEATPLEAPPFEHDSFDSEIQRMMEMLHRMQKQEPHATSAG